MSVILLLLLTLSCSPVFAQSTLPLSPDPTVQQNESPSERSAGGPAILPTMGAIVIVAGVFLLLLWLLKKSEGNTGRNIPDSVVKTLGKTRIGSYPVFLVAVGKKLVLVAVSSNGLTPLTEINEPAEAESIRKALSGENGGGK